MTQEETQAQAIAKDLGTDPLMERSLGWLIATLPKRLITMVTKLLSLKGIAWGAWLYLVVGSVQKDLEHATTLIWVFALITLVMIFGEKVLKYIKDIRG